MNSLLNLRKFLAPEIIFGNGARKLAGQYCNNFMLDKVIIVTDPGLIHHGWVKQIETSLSDAGVDYVIFSEVSPNPRAEETMKGAEIFRANNCSGIVSIGGGSPMDCAKGIGIVISNDGHILDYEGVDKIPIPLPPMIFIPSTAGTSADVSQFCIISDQQEKVKKAIVSKSIIPDVALIDPEITTTMDSYLTACTGMDTLVHAIEAFVSTASSKMTDLHALHAISIIGESLPETINQPLNLTLRENITAASMHAGLAFSNAVLGAVHAMAHSLGGYLDLPHGECNSLLLEHVINFNFDAAPDKFKIIAQTLNIDIRGMNNTQIKNALFNYIRQLRNTVGITKRLELVGVRQADVITLAKKAVKDACIHTNPRKANLRDIELIYEEAR